MTILHQTVGDARKGARATVMVLAPMPVTAMVNVVTKAQTTVRALAMQVDVVAAEIWVTNRHAMVVAGTAIPNNPHAMHGSVWDRD